MHSDVQFEGLETGFQAEHSFLCGFAPPPIRIFDALLHCRGNTGKLKNIFDDFSAVFELDI